MIKCIFCKQDSRSSRSVEHIVPESLGNKSYVLAKGIVCDTCNQYFALKIEKPVLEMEFFRNVRFRNAIISKKRKIPSGTVEFSDMNIKATISVGRDDPTSLHLFLDEESAEKLFSGDIRDLRMAVNLPFDNVHVSRLLCKMALEIMANTFYGHDGGIEYIIEETQLDPIRNYVRFNEKRENWVYSVRVLYSEVELFSESGKIVDRIFEADFLQTNNELYFIFCYKGYEFTINMAGSDMEGYHQWLHENKNISPLSLKPDSNPKLF